MTLVHVANGNTDVQHNVLWPLQDLAFHYKFMHYIGMKKKKQKKKTLQGPGNGENEDLYLSRIGSG